MSGKQDALLVLHDCSAFDGIPSQPISLMAPQAQPSPIPAYDEQPDQGFARGLSLYGARYGAADKTIETPLNQLFLFTLENARFVLHPGLDGMIIDQQHRMIIEPRAFASTACTNPTNAYRTCKSMKSRMRYSWGSMQPGGTTTTGYSTVCPKCSLPRPIFLRRPVLLYQTCRKRKLPDGPLSLQKPSKHLFAWQIFRIVFSALQTACTEPKNFISSGTVLQCPSCI